MKLLVVGGSSGIGRETVSAALTAGHQVTALARSPERLGLQHAQLELVAVDVLDEAALRRVVAAHDAVICTLGLPTLQAIGPPFAKRSFVLSIGTRNLIQAMRQAKVKRLLVVTAIGAGESVRDCSPLARLMFRAGLRWLFQQKDRQEELVRDSGLDWTIIRPTALTNGPRRGAEVGERLRAGGFTQVSRADVAAALMELLADKSSFRKALTLRYPPRFGDSVRWARNYW